MKIAIVTDTHFGVRGDTNFMLDYQASFFENTFFPIIKQEKIKTIFHLGDLVDRRKFVNFHTSNRMKRIFVNPILENNIKVHIIPGNHDVYYKNTNEINALTELLPQSDLIDIIHEPKVLNYGSSSFIFIPWVNDNNREQIKTFLKKQDVLSVVCGHLEFEGFEMYKGAVCSHGEDEKIFSKFNEVWSGHFHHKSQQRNIKYLGAPYEMTWSDYDDPRGFHVYDTEKETLEFFRNEERLFIKVWYDDTDKELIDLLDFNADKYKNKYIKIILQEKNNAYYFDKFIEKIEAANPIKIQVVEDHKNINLVSDEDLIDEGDDTLTMLNTHLDTIKVDKAEELKDIFKELYFESLNYNAE